MLGRIQIADEEVGKALVLHRRVGVEDVLHRAGIPRDGRENVADAFLNALGDGDLAFARQELHRAHLPHVHAHRIGGAAGFRLHRRQCRRSFLRGEFVGGVVAGIQQFVRIGRRLVHGDAHVVDHADDVFDLVRIADVVRNVIVDLRIGKEPLFLAFRDQILESGLLAGVGRHFAPFWLCPRAASPAGKVFAAACLPLGAMELLRDVSCVRAYCAPKKQATIACLSSSFVLCYRKVVSRFDPSACSGWALEPGDGLPARRFGGKASRPPEYDAPGGARQVKVRHHPPQIWRRCGANQDAALATSPRESLLDLASSAAARSSRLSVDSLSPPPLPRSARRRS